ncbi:putative ATPase [Marisediminicola sp. UYEF4]|uniref:DUF4062 domain-containing protein n=1 Tax=Marisediminicola sp. UYEF4 TaxID=1756384 RepID=UPI003393EA04
MNPSAGVIRTPDQRLRVFVSSTLKELAPERRAARVAVERLHLAPVMFELGARPHPPRDLYRAYLEQSDVFVGLYWEAYGWVAPTETVSGLEDEYNLATRLPKLIYIKEPKGIREPRLVELLDRIRNDDGASFKYFSTPQELRRLLEDDLATLLAERFDLSRRPLPPPERPPVTDTDTGAIPAPLTSLIGRDDELLAVEAMLRRESVRLVTLTGPGGIGKSRLAIGVAKLLSESVPGEVAFVDLAPVQDAALVPNAIAQALGVRDTGDQTLEEKLTTALRQRRMLIVVDNFEQVLDAATTLTALLTMVPTLKFLVTSRTLLRVTGEHTYEIGPLALPGPRARLDPAELLDSASVALFVERVRAVKPDFELTADNAHAVAAICRELDGVPLALELAAARIRTLAPAAMLARLDRRLPLLSAGAKDLPPRQQTLRRTIEWSTQLLGPDEKRLLALLGVFAGGFSLEAAEFVAGDAAHADPLTSLGILVDNSLVREQDCRGRSRFSILATVREYALEQLEASGTFEAIRARHAEYYVELADRIEFDLEGVHQREWVGRLNDDRDNLRAAVRFLLDHDDWDTAARFAWDLFIFWWVGGLLGEVRGWMEEVLAAKGALTDRTRAIALYFTRSITLWQDPNEWVVPGLTESAELFHRVHDRSGEGLSLISVALALLADEKPDPVHADEALMKSLELFREQGDGWGEAMALVTLGRVALMDQKIHRSVHRFQESLSLARDRHEELGTAIALHHLGWAKLVAGSIDEARDAFNESLATSAALGHAEGVAYGLEGLIAIAAAEGEIQRAGRLLRAAEALRRQTGLYNATSFSFHQHYLAPILAGDDASDLEAARTEGRDMSMEDVVAFALAGHAS